MKKLELTVNHFSSPQEDWPSATPEVTKQDKGSRQILTFVGSSYHNSFHITLSKLKLIIQTYHSFRLFFLKFNENQMIWIKIQISFALNSIEISIESSVLVEKFRFFFSIQILSDIHYDFGSDNSGSLNYCDKHCELNFLWLWFHTVCPLFSFFVCKHWIFKLFTLYLKLCMWSLYFFGVKQATKNFLL